MPVRGVRDYVLTEHALFEMKRRGISEDILRSVLTSPEQRFEVRVGRVALQSRTVMGVPEKSCLLRVIVEPQAR